MEKKEKKCYAEICSLVMKCQASWLAYLPHHDRTVNLFWLISRLRLNKASCLCVHRQASTSGEESKIRVRFAPSPTGVYACSGGKLYVSCV